MLDIHCDASVVSPRGHRIFVDLDDTRARALRRADGVLNAGTSRMWEAALALRDWDLVVDIGANYGEMVLGTELPGSARVICYEPNPRVVPYLRRSLEKSGVAVELRETAIGSRDGSASFAIDTVWSGRSGLVGAHRTDAPHHPLATVEVPVRTLDSELGDDRTSSVCVKVDVEGGELDVLEGARELLAGSRPWAVLLEILHMRPFEKAELARRFRMSVLDRRTGQLVTVPPATARHVSELLESEWIYPQDAILTPRAVR